MKNTLEDLNNHLFAQIERLGDEDLTSEKLETELKRSREIANIASKIVDNGRLALDVQKALGSGSAEFAPRFLEVTKK
ncbi:hypothetical protein [Limnobaculum xujianqingii]|uniref:hypothetical protein n=1 Tax=Limnobaculum xujianqingii TaxID=2738837 RepID=UPI0011261D8A|nr:hypothetical protein [Limnobaculum xujianqingii]